MTEKQIVSLAEVPGFQHAKDDYWARPVILGKNLYTYVAQVPSGGYMPPNGHAEKEEFETSLFLLEGELEITYNDETFVIGPETAMHRPLGVHFGVRNRGNVTATYVLTFSPLPRNETLEEKLERYARENRGVKTPEEMNAMRAIGTQ